MQERRRGERYNISFPVRVQWKEENGREVVQDGLTENIGPSGTLIFLPNNLPSVGNKVSLTVTENAEDEVSVTAQVIRLERNPAHQQCALKLTDSIRIWRSKVWKAAAEIVANEEPEDFDDW